PEGRQEPSPTHPTAAAAPHPAAPGGGGSFIQIQPLESPRASGAGSTSMGVSVGPTPVRYTELQQADEHLATAHWHVRQARPADARGEYQEAARLYRLIVERGGRDAPGARARLEACERGLAALR